MIQDTDNKVIEDTLNDCPVIASDFLRLGFSYHYSHDNNPEENGWMYTDADGNRIVLSQGESRLDGFDCCWKGDVYFPQYTDMPRLRIPDPEKRSCRVIIYTVGQLKMFVEIAERAAQLRMGIKKESDIIKGFITTNLWKG